MNAQQKLLNFQVKRLKNKIAKDKNSIKLLKAEIAEMNEILSKLSRTDIVYKEKQIEKRKLAKKINLLEKAKTDNENKIEVLEENK